LIGENFRIRLSPPKASGGRSASDVMCATARMMVKHKGAAHPTDTACTLLPYNSEFDLGETIAEARGSVQLNRPHCAKFCVLGGATCARH
jgi:hypothetical protein